MNQGMSVNVIRDVIGEEMPRLIGQIGGKKGDRLCKPRVVVKTSGLA